MVALSAGDFMMRAMGAQPNIIVFFTDQQRWDASGLHGNPLDLMPNFDAYAQRGTHVYNSFTCQPVCGPARACLQTGLYGTTTGCFTNAKPLPPDARTMAHYFNDAGYQTGYIGKWHLATGRGAVAQDQRGGYGYWLGANALEATSDAYRCDVFDGADQAVRLPGYRVDALTDAAIGYVDQHKERPFFLFLSHLEPHFQNHLDDYPPPFGYRERYSGRWIPPDLAALGGSTHQHLGGYWGMVKRVDEAFGRLMDALISLGLRDNTIVLFTSDHACHFKTRNSEYKRSCHESSIRVPTMLCGGPFEGGGQLRQLVSLIDLPPTLLDAAGIKVPEHWQGRSILPLLGRPRGTWPEEMFIQISETQVGRAIRTQRWKYSVHAPDKRAAIDMGSDRYEEEFLYDLQSDPYELRNLIGMQSHRAVAERMKQRLIKRMVEAGEAPPTIVSHPVTEPSKQRVVTAEEIEQ